MAVLTVKVASIIGRMNELEHVTAICGKSSMFHPDNSLSFYSDTSRFVPLNEENPYAEPLRRLTAATEGCRKKLNILSKEQTEDVSVSIDDMNTYVDYIVSSFTELQKEREQAQNKVEKYTHSIEEVSRFVGLDLNLDEISKCKNIKVRFGSLPKESFEKLNSYNDNPYVIFFSCTNDTQRYWGVYFSPIDVVSKVDRIFSRLYFERIHLAELKGSPESSVEKLRTQREIEIENIKRIDREINTLWEKEKNASQRIYSWLTARNICFGIRRYAARYNDNFILTGWVPAEYESEFKKQLDLLETIEYTFDDGKEQLSHSPPVSLRNKSLFKPFEYFVDMYGLPTYDEIDPTPLVAMTYVLLFGIMFGDLGQGICVSLIGAWMWKLKKMPLGKILIPCGISSALFGVIFGSVFGFEHMLDIFYKKVFGLSEKPIEVMDSSKTNLIIGSAIALGVILVMIAIIINIYSSLRRRHYESALFGPNGVAGLVLYSSAILGSCGQFLLGWTVFTPAYILCLLVLPIIVMFFKEVLGGLAEHRNNWYPESWADYCMQNFFEVFEYLLSYASNTISFLRVSAFVLVHAGMMNVVFTLAGKPGIAYFIVIVLGNIIVMVLEGLLVGIQSLRLEFYELFSRFFDGQGRPFRPIVIQ